MTTAATGSSYATRTVIWSNLHRWSVVSIRGSGAVAVAAGRGSSACRPIFADKRGDGPAACDALACGSAWPTP